MQDQVSNQAAALPLRITDDRLHALLVTSTSGRWILPKGNLEPGRTAAAIAAQEAFEEAGVIGAALQPPIGECTVDRPAGAFRLTVFALPIDRVLATWKEQHRRSRLWVPLNVAPEQIEIPELARLIATFVSDHAAVTELTQRLMRRQIA